LGGSAPFCKRSHAAAVCTAVIPNSTRYWQTGKEKKKKNRSKGRKRNWGESDRKIPPSQQVKSLSLKGAQKKHWTPGVLSQLVERIRLLVRISPTQGEKEKEREKRAGHKKDEVSRTLKKCTTETSGTKIVTRENQKQHSRKPGTKKKKQRYTQSGRTQSGTRDEKKKTSRTVIRGDNKDSTTCK